MFEVVTSSNTSLEECAKDLQQKIAAILAKCPKAIIGSTQAPSVHVPDEGAPAFYASAILHEAPAQPQEEEFSAKAFMKKMGLPVAHLPGATKHKHHRPYPKSAATTLVPRSKAKPVKKTAKKQAKKFAKKKAK